MRDETERSHVAMVELPKQMEVFRLGPVIEECLRLNRPFVFSNQSATKIHKYSIQY